MVVFGLHLLLSVHSPLLLLCLALHERLQLTSVALKVIYLLAVEVIFPRLILDMIFMDIIFNLIDFIGISIVIIIDITFIIDIINGIRVIFIDELTQEHTLIGPGHLR